MDNFDNDPMNIEDINRHLLAMQHVPPEMRRARDPEALAQHHRMLLEGVRQEPGALFQILEHRFHDPDNERPAQPVAILGQLMAEPGNMALAIPQPAAPVPRRRQYSLGSGFPIICTVEFDKAGHKTQINEGAWENLQWTMHWSYHKSTFGILVGRATLSFDGMGDRVYKVSSSFTVSETPMENVNNADDVCVIDKYRSHIVYPNTMCTSPDSGPDGHIVTPTTVLKVIIHNIEPVNEFLMTGQCWPQGTKWINFYEKYSIKMAEPTLLRHQPNLEFFLSHLKNASLATREVTAFYEFAGALCHKWFYGQDKFHLVLLDGYKLGFTNRWNEFDGFDSPFDFQTRTMLPLYQSFTDVTPIEHKYRSSQPNGSCNRFLLELDPSKLNKHSQIGQMDQIKGHKGQYSFYLEQSDLGVVLIAGLCIQPMSSQYAKLKVIVFENSVATIRHTYQRIVTDKHRAIKMVVAVLTEEHIKLMREGNLSITTQLYLEPCTATFVQNYEDPEDWSSPIVMPGLINGYLNCKDGKMIGICKEHLSQQCETLKMFFYNHAFVDCGKDVVNVDENSEIVLDALNVIYHRAHSIPVQNVQKVWELGNYWLCPIIQRYIDMAVLQTNLFSVEEKIIFSNLWTLDTTKYILRHPEYATNFRIIIPDDELKRLNQQRTNAELDFGRGGEVVE